jgi:hypothetical protein
MPVLAMSGRTARAAPKERNVRRDVPGSRSDGFGGSVGTACFSILATAKVRDLIACDLNAMKRAPDQSLAVKSRAI